MRDCHVGDLVLVQMFDGRIMRGVVKQVSETTSGTKIQVHVGDLALKVDAFQIMQVLADDYPNRYGIEE